MIDLFWYNIHKYLLSNWFQNYETFHHLNDVGIYNPQHQSNHSSRKLFDEALQIFWLIFFSFLLSIFYKLIISFEITDQYTNVPFTCLKNINLKKIIPELTFACFTDINMKYPFHPNKTSGGSIENQGRLNGVPDIGNTNT